MRSARKGAKIKIGVSFVLILEVKVSHAVDEGPKRGQNKNWRASCAVFSTKKGQKTPPKNGQHSLLF